MVVVADLISFSGGNVNERDEAGNTLLHIIDSKDQIKALLQYINVDTTNDNGETPLWGKISNISKRFFLTRLFPF